MKSFNLEGSSLNMQQKELYLFLLLSHLVHLSFQAAKRVSMSGQQMVVEVTQVVEKVEAVMTVVQAVVIVGVNVLRLAQTIAQGNAI